MHENEKNIINDDLVYSDINQTLKLEQEIAQIYDMQEKAKALMELGLAEAFRKNYEKAIKHLEDAQKLFLESKNIPQIAICLAELALIHYQKCNDRLIRSLTLLNDAKYLIENHEFRTGPEAKILHYYGIIYYYEKRFSEALKYFKSAQKLISRDSLEYAKILDSLSIFYLRVNNNQIAIKSLKDSLKIKRTINNKRELAITALLLGRYLSSIENYDDAIDYLLEALDTTEFCGDYLSAARIQDELAKIYLALEKYNLALDYCYKSIAMAKKINAPLVYAFSSCTLATIKIHKNKPLEAIDFLKNEAKVIFTDHSSIWGYAIVKRIKASAYQKMGNTKDAIENLHESAELFREAGIHAEVARCYYELSIIYRDSRDIPMALSSLLESLRIAKYHNLLILTKKIEDLLFEIDEEEWSNIINKTAQKEALFTEGRSLLDTLALIEDKSDTTSKGPLLALLKIGRSIAAETDVNKLLEIIAEETKRALGADRCTVFLLDKSTNELWSKVALGMGSQEIRFPAHMGFAGHVALTGETINIKDTYNDPRFNKEIDKKTGYRTKTILCMPMRNLNHEIVGVFQVLNKIGENKSFTDEDEDLLIAIGSSAGIALENARLFKKQQFMYEEQKKSFTSFINTLAASIDARDKITAGHSKRVTEYSIAIAEQMQLKTDEIEAIEYAAMLHDFGKIGVKDSVLCKKGKLTESEYKHIQEHVFITSEILKTMFFEEKFKNVPMIASSHHEKFNGTGYFRGIKEDEIPLGGRILAVSDVFDALTSRRHYRNRMPVLDVLNIFVQDNREHFDSAIVEEFFKINLFKILTILLSTENMPLLENNQNLFKENTLQNLYVILNRDKAERNIEEKLIVKTFEKCYHLSNPNFYNFESK